MFYVGLDIHTKRIAFCVLSDKGQLVQRGQVRRLDEILRVLPTPLIVTAPTNGPCLAPPLPTQHRGRGFARKWCSCWERSRRWLRARDSQASSGTRHRIGEMACRVEADLVHRCPGGD